MKEKILKQARALHRCLLLEAKAKQARDDYRQKFSLEVGFFSSYGMDHQRIAEAQNLTLYVPLNVYLSIFPDETPQLEESVEGDVGNEIIKTRMVYPTACIGTMNNVTVWIASSTPPVRKPRPIQNQTHTHVIFA
jgi:hypothetical protein